MAVIHHICDRVAVMWNGKIVEEGTRDEVIERPKHQYTKRSSVPCPKPIRGGLSRLTFEGMRM